jgi:integrase
MAERSPGVWEISVSLGVKDERGRYRRLSRTVHGTKTAAQKALRTLIGEVEAGKHHNRPSLHLTVAEMLHRWYGAEQPGWSPAHAAQTLRIIEQRIGPKFGSARAGELRAPAIEAWLAQLSISGRRDGKGLSDGQVHKTKIILAAAYADAVRLGDLPHSPMLVVRVRKGRRADRGQDRRTAHTVADLWPMVEAAEWYRPGFGVFVHLAIITGARRGEILALRWSDIDLVAQSVKVERALSFVGGVLHEGPTKNDSSIRAVPIDAVTVAALKAWRRQLAELSLANGARLSNSWRVWPIGTDPTGETPWHVDTPSKWWRTVANTIGLETTALHSCRHAVATTMLSAGVDPRTVADHLGHASPAVTLDVYSAAVPARSRAAVEALAATVIPAT